MKKLFAALLVFATLAVFSACRYSGMQDPVSFYYPRREIAYGNADGVIGTETREAAGHKDDLRYLLAVYLQGPLDETLYSPFPAGCRLLSVSTAGDTIAITLDSRFASLHDLDLSIACASLAKTCLTLSGAQSVHIESTPAENDSANAVNIILSRNSVLLEEAVVTVPVGDPTE